MKTKPTAKPADSRISLTVKLTRTDYARLAAMAARPGQDGKLPSHQELMSEAIREYLHNHGF